MRMKNGLGMLFLGVCALGWVSCNEDVKIEQVYPLTFEKEAYRVRMNLNESIPVIGGSKSYALRVEDPAVLEAEVAFPSTVGFGEIRITPKEKGKTALFVTDQVSEETKRLSVEVTDFYMGFTVVESSHPDFPEGEALFLVANASKNCFLLKESGEMAPAIEVDKRGDYAFSVVDNAPRLVLNWREETTEKMQTYTFDISSSKREIIAMLNRWFALGWENTGLRMVTPPAYTFLVLKDAKYTVRCRILGAALPEELLR